MNWKLLFYLMQITSKNFFNGTIKMELKRETFSMNGTFILIGILKIIHIV